jgi:hypothetical protein
VSVAVSGSPTPSVTGRRGEPRGLASAAAAAARESASACARSVGSSVADRASDSAVDAIRSLTRFCAACQHAVCSSGSRVSSHGLELCAFSSGSLTTFRIRSSCHRQTPKTIPNATMQMMMRVRSSSRCSTSERRSSCPMGLSRVAVALRRSEVARAR